MPRPERYIIKKKVFDNMRLLDRHSSVLIRIEKLNRDRQTKSGIYVVGDTDFDQAGHADRIGIVEWVPDKLNINEMQWETGCELQVGDTVWFDYLMGLNCVQFDVEGVEYKFMNYCDLYLAKRGDKHIMLNGYCLFDLIKDESESEFAIETGKKDARYGIGRYMGKANRGYKSDHWHDDERVKTGVKVIFGMPPVLLEDSLHQEFENGSEMRISQRKFVLGIEQDGNVIPTKGHVLVKPDDPDKETKGGLEIPEAYRKKSKYATVLINEGKGELKEGDRIHFSPSSATYVDDKDNGEVCLLKENAIPYKIKQ